MRRYKTRPARDWHKPSRSNITSSRTATQASPPRNQLQARRRRGLPPSKQLSTTRRAPRVKAHRVGVLRTGVPRSTCWKAHLRPIFIDTTKDSASTRPSRRGVPRGGTRHHRRGISKSPRGATSPHQGQLCKPHHQGTSSRQGGDVACSPPSGPPPPEGRRV